MSNAVATYAREMASDRTYGHPIPVPKWWLRDLGMKLEILRRTYGTTQRQVAERVSAIVGHTVHPEYITRCKKGEVTTLELVLALSTVLDLPAPIFFAETEDDAVWLKQQIHLRSVGTTADGAPKAPPAKPSPPRPKTPTTHGVVPIEPRLRRRKAGGHR